MLTTKKGGYILDI